MKEQISETEEKPSETTTGQLTPSTTSLLDILQNETAVRTLQESIIAIMTTARASNNSERFFRMVGIVVVVSATIGLSFFDELSPAAAVILGSIAGYLFGKDPKD